MFDYKSYVQQLQMLKHKEELLKIQLKRIQVDKTNLSLKRVKEKQKELKK